MVVEKDQARAYSGSSAWGRLRPLALEEIAQCCPRAWCVCVWCLPVLQQPHVLRVLVGNRATAVGDTQVDLLGRGTCLPASPPEDDAYRFA